MSTAPATASTLHGGASAGAVSASTARLQIDLDLGDVVQELHVAEVLDLLADAEHAQRHATARGRRGV